VHLKEKLEVCTARVNSKPGTAETCEEELFDFMHCVDHCVRIHFYMITRFRKSLKKKPSTPTKDNLHVSVYFQGCPEAVKPVEIKTKTNRYMLVFFRKALFISSNVTV
jgi:hypothetical protein